MMGSRHLGVLISALALLGMMISALPAAKPVFAASVTTSADTTLNSGPGADYPVVTTVPVGSPLAIDGPPEGGFYPVTVNGQSGWMSGAVLDIVKDDAVAASATEPAPVAGTDPAAAPVSAYDNEPPADAAEPTVAPADANTAPADPNAVPATDPNAAPADQNPDPNAIPATDPSAAPPATDPNAAPAADPATPAPGTATVNPDPAPAASPTPTPVPAVSGEATVPNGATLFYEPNSSSGTVFWVPAGSTVWRIGEERNGFAHADYMAMVGWIAIDQLAAPVAVTAEVVSDDAEWADDVRTPRPGSGVAFTTVDIALRAGPSAAEVMLMEVPADSRVVMTGVMENGFHRIDYKGNVGWVASDYLSTPPNPDEVDPAVSRGDNKTYTRDEIVKIINAAADRYGQDRSDLLRVAECESALDPYAVHPSGSYGLFQFIRSTWRSTPYGDQSMFDPKANANAAAWMWQQGRRSEWVCK